jgi:hypothetical protein
MRTPTIEKEEPIILPDHISKCLNKTTQPTYEHYIIAVTLIQNKRGYTREWIEFHLLMGFSHFIFYDNGSEDGLKEFLQPYIDENIASYVVWPPQPKMNFTFSDVSLEENFKVYMANCYNDTAIIHRQLACQQSAFSDAIRRTRGKTRWLTAIDIDEYFYPPESSFFNRFKQPLAEIFKTLEKHDEVIVIGQHFGTSGWLSPPRRDDDSTHSQLMIKTHTHHVKYHGVGLISISQHQKAFVDPYCTYASAIHIWLYDEAKLANFSMKYLWHNDDIIYMNHYLWTSMTETIEKAILNRNPETTYDKVYDQLVNKDEGLLINYLIEPLEKRLQSSVINRPPRDRHGDDWDYTLFQKHRFNPSAPTDLCIAISSPRHLGLIRHTLTSIFYYFYKVEPKLNIKMIVHDAMMEELKRDFPIDLFTDNKTISFKDDCSAEFVLHLKEDSFARWELWPETLKVFHEAFLLFQNEPSVNAIYLGDSKNNLMSLWKILTPGNVSYRINSGLSKESGSYLIRNKDLGDVTLHEICLRDDKNCYRNEIRGLFEKYYQERLYGYKPGFSS